MPICQHLDIRKFDEIRCCLSCGEAIVEDFQENAQEYDYTVTSGYQYRRLNYKLGQEIRLVVVFPGSGNEVRCDIIHANLLDEPSYEATSYTWATATGDKTLSHHVVCRGGRIPITRNCLAMLRRLRRSDTSRTLWVDAISIDQNNLDEKNHQVKLMSTIYSKASQVLAYLGPMSDETREVVHKIVDEIADKTDTGGSFTDKPCLNRRQLRIFLDLPYFNRVWILQEVALAKAVSLIAGARTIWWTAETVTKLLQICSSQDVAPPSVLQWMPATRPDTENLLDVLYRSRNCSSTNNRDKVYGLLGLVQPRVSDAISVDYSASEEDVFTDVAIYLMTKQNRLDTMLHVVEQPVKTWSSCSWVPRWDLKRVYETLRRQFSTSEIDLLATSWFPPILRPSAVSPTLVLQQNAVYQSERFPFAITIRSLISKPTRTFPVLRIRGHFVDTIVTELRGPDKEWVKEWGEWHIPQEVSRGLPAFCGTHASSECLKNSPTPLAAVELKNAQAKLATEHRKLFNQTRDSYDGRNDVLVTNESIGFTCGMANNQYEIRVGDTIWALAGLAVLMVLRKVEDHYVVQGSCFLYRATLPHQCASCGLDAKPWPMVTEVIDIW